MNKLNGLILSDLHLDNSNYTIDTEGKDFVILAGDIATDLSLLHNLFNYQLNTIPVFYVPGNHEYEGYKITEHDNTLRQLCNQYSNIHFLQNEEYIWNNIRFLGTTLWTDLSLYEPEITQKNMIDLVVKNVCDYQTIRGKNGKLTPDETLQLHNEAVKFLEFKLRKDCFDGDTIVITHFLPHKKSINGNYINNTLNPYYASNLENLMGFSKYWIHGHTHESVCYNIEGTEVICNARGYSPLFNLSSNINHNPNYTIQLDCNLNLSKKTLNKLN